MNERIHYLQGNKIFLSPTIEEDIPFIVAIQNDPEVRKYLSSRENPLSEEEELKNLQSLQAAGGSYFTIFSQDDDVLVGFIKVHSVTRVNRNCELTMAIAPKEQKKQYGREALNLIIRYCFLDRNLHNIMLSVKSYNKIAIHFYESMGFKLVGTRREALFYGGKYVNYIMFDLIPEDISEDLKDF